MPKGQKMASSKCFYYEILNFSSIVRLWFSKQFSVTFLKHHKRDHKISVDVNYKMLIEQGCLFHAQMIFVLLHIRTTNFVTQR